MESGLVEKTRTKRFRKSFYNFYRVADDGSHLLFNGFRGSLIAFTDEEIKEVRHLLTEGYDESIAEKSEICDALINNGMLVEEEVDERELIKLNHWGDRCRTDILHLTLLPTLKCNFRCVYCYESFPNATMTDDVEDRIVKFVAKRIQGARHIPIGWFGGECLTQFDRMYSTTRRIQDLCEESGNGAKVTTTLCTNGYLLTPDKFSKLKEMNLRGFQVTIDGAADTHDELRVLAGGAPTFDRIFSNIVALSESELASQVRFQIRVNCNKTMLSSVSELLEKLPESVKKISNLYFRNIWFCNDRGTWQERELHDPEVKLSPEDLTQMLDSAVAKHNIRPSQMLLKPRTMYCGAQDNKSIVIGPHGELYKCTLELDPGDHIGILDENGTPQYNTPDYIRWAAQDPFSDAECMQCKNLPMCIGGCPKGRPARKTCLLDSDVEGLINTMHQSHLRKASVPEPVA